MEWKEYRTLKSRENTNDDDSDDDRVLVFHHYHCNSNCDRFLTQRLIL